MVFHGIWNGICLLVMGNPMSMEVSIEVSGWENHRTKLWIFQQAMFDYQRVICLVMTNIAIEAMAIKSSEFSYSKMVMFNSNNEFSYTKNGDVQ